MTLETMSQMSDDPLISLPPLAGWEMLGGPNRPTPREGAPSHGGQYCNARFAMWPAFWTL